MTEKEIEYLLCLLEQSENMAKDSDYSQPVWLDEKELNYLHRLVRCHMEIIRLSPGKKEEDFRW